MNKTRIMLIVAFVAAFAAGAAATTMVSRPEPPAKGRGPWLARDLNLTDAQREQIEAIWDQAFQEVRKLNLFEQRNALREQREEAVRRLLGESTYTQYREIYDVYHEAVKKIEHDRHVIFEQAKEKTTQLLTEEQKAKWQELMERRTNDRHRRGGRGDGNGRPQSGPPSGPPPGPPPHRPRPDDREESPGPASAPVSANTHNDIQS